MNINIFTFSGRLTAEPNIKEFDDKTVYNFNVAVNTYAGKNKESEVFYVECSLWGDRGKYLAKFGKGTEVTITGKLTPRKWTNKEGVEKQILGCFVNDYAVHCRPEGDKPGKLPKQRPTVVETEPEPEDEDDDVPF